jgi:hypothetical protein
MFDPSGRPERTKRLWHQRCGGGLPIDFEPLKEAANRLRTAISALTLHNSSIQLDVGRATTAANRHRKTFFRKSLTCLRLVGNNAYTE